MYHADQKAAFLSQFQNPSDSYKLFKNVFLSIEGTEERVGKDVALFDHAELDEVFPDIAGVRYESSVSMLSQLRRYVKWCDEQGYPVCDSIFSYEPDLSENVRRCYVRSPEHLLYVMSTVFKHPEDNQIEYIYRSYLWLAYLGFTEQEAADVCISDVDFDKQTVRDKQMYEEAMFDLRMACRLTELIELKRNYVIARAKGDKILRGKPTTKTLTEALVTTYRQSVSKMFKRAEKMLTEIGNHHPDLESIQLSYKRVYLSGMFYRVHRRELLHEPVDFGYVVEERYERDKEKFTHAENKVNKSKYHMKLGYLEDYKAWKRAFGLQ